MFSKMSEHWSHISNYTLYNDHQVNYFCLFYVIAGSIYGSSYPLGIHRFTFTGMLNNLYLRILMPSTIPRRTVHSRSIATSQFNESDFGALSQMPQCTNGTPPAILIGIWMIIAMCTFTLWPNGNIFSQKLHFLLAQIVCWVLWLVERLWKHPRTRVLAILRAGSLHLMVWNI